MNRENNRICLPRVLRKSAFLSIVCGGKPNILPTTLLRASGIPKKI